MPKPAPEPRAAYRWFTPISIRWADVDVYGHVNNVVYYAWFDTAVNQHLVEAGALDPGGSAITGIVAHTECDYFSEIRFPGRVEAGLRVDRLGVSSVAYRIGLFRAGEDAPAAQGGFVHVYVARGTARAAPVPDAVRAALSPLL